MLGALSISKIFIYFRNTNHLTFWQLESIGSCMPTWTSSTICYFSKHSREKKQLQSDSNAKKNICCIYCFQQNPRTIKTNHNRSDNPQIFIKCVRNLHRSLTFPEFKKSFISLPAYDKSTENGDLTIRRLCLDKTSTTI